MADDNDTQAQALIAALAPKIAAAIIPQLAEQVETQIKGIDLPPGSSLTLM
jgi:hypothetical protein